MAITSINNPKFIKWEEDDYGEIFELEYGSYEARQTIKLKIDLYELTIKE